MTTATDKGEAAESARKRRGRLAGNSDEQSKPRFFAGEMTSDGIKLSREFRTEPEAQLESLKQDQPYYTVEAWKATADLSNGTIAVTKRPAVKA